MTFVLEKEGRVAARQRRNREALVTAGYRIISEKGIDAATMQEIANLADVGAGTIYSYFRSKDELVVTVMERVMHNLALRIQQVTDRFDDPGQVYAYGIRSVIDAATGDLRWKQLLNRSEVIADAMFRCLGPFAIRDLRNASQAGRFSVDNAELTWKLATDAIIGVSLAITSGKLSPNVVPETVVRLLCMAGLTPKQAKELADRPRPPLPKEN